MTKASVLSPSPSSSGPRRAARQREVRRIRVLARMQPGCSYAAIGREAAISRECAWRIAAPAPNAGDSATKFVHARGAPVARLEQALRLAARERLPQALRRLDSTNAESALDALQPIDPE